MRLKIFHLLLILLPFVFLASFTLKQHDPAVLADTNADGLKICVISDLNSSYGSTTYGEDVKAVISRLALIKPDIILCAGDMVAGQKASLTPKNIEDMWSGFKTTVLNPINKLKIPFGFTVGNHDASPSFVNDRAFAEQFWKENAKATGLTFVDSTHYPFYYSYTKKNAFFISWDAAGAEIKQEVFDWVKAQLSGKIAGKAGLRILIGHLPLYAIVDSKNKPGEVNSAPETALGFFKNHGVDLYISGHQHAYYPAEKEGVRFLNMGCIGDGPRKLIGDTAAAARSYTMIDVPVRNAKKFTYRTYTTGDNELVEIESLPDSVIGFNGVSRKDRN